MQSLFCVHHNEPIKGICFFQGQCDDRLMCRACRKTHDSNHLNYYEELDDDFYNGSLVIQLKEEFEAMIKALDSQNSTYENNSSLLISQIDYFVKEIQTHIIQRLIQTRDTLMENINKKLQKNNALKQEIKVDRDNMANAYDRAITSKFNPPSTADTMVQAIYKAQALYERVNNDPELQAQQTIDFNMTQLATAVSANHFRQIKTSLEEICQDIEGSFTLNNPIKQLSVSKGRMLPNDELHLEGGQRYNNPSSSANLLNQDLSSLLHRAQLNNRNMTPYQGENRKKASEPKYSVQEVLKYFKMADEEKNGPFPEHGNLKKYSRGKESRSYLKRRQLLEFYDKVATSSNQIMVSGLAYIANQNRLAVAEKQGMIELIDVRTLKRVGYVKGHETEICCILYVPEKEVLLSADANGHINVWDCKSELKGPRSFTKHTKAVLALDYLPGSELVISGGDDECIRMWNIKTCKEVQAMRTKNSKIGSLCKLGNSNRIAVGFDKGIINIIIIEPIRKIDHSITAHNRYVTTLKYLDEPQVLISGSEDGFIKMWRIYEAKSDFIFKISPEGSIIRNFLVMENRDLLVGNFSDKYLRFYRLSTGEKLEEHFDKTYGEGMIALENANQIATGNVSDIKFWTLNEEEV